MNNPFVLVIFGATGDLTQKKLIPVLFGMFKKHALPKTFYIVGVARREFSSVAFADLFADFTSDPQWNDFTGHLVYHQASFDDDSKYLSLAALLDELDKKSSHQLSRIFYLATPPEHYDTILSFLFAHKDTLSQQVMEQERFAKLAIEKPFGKDIETAKALDQRLADDFPQWQIFRVDHYLGKETVQNLLVFRFANSIFEPVWNNQFVDHIQITFSEEKGIGNRGRFFDGIGILRDVGQNHLMQLVAAVAMEMPKSFSKEGIRDARAQAIKSFQCVSPSNIENVSVRGQYAGYVQEKDVASDSLTETFVALKFFLDTPRFLGVPFYLRAGKALSKAEVTISVVFRQTCHILFKEIGCPEEGNILTFHIQPQEGISLQMIAKQPGTKPRLQIVDMNFSYHDQFKIKSIEAYEKILIDIFSGDQMLFNRSDELESSWQFITSIIDGWSKTNAPMTTYDKGSMGPKEAQELIEKDGRKWI